jgi:hypothetical protein
MLAMMGLRRWLLWLTCGLVSSSAAFGQGGDAVRIEKVDPPNWWAKMPKAMLLLGG